MSRLAGTFDVPLSKVVDYLLSVTHKAGINKATYFKGFGFDPSASQVMIDALTDHPIMHDVASMKDEGFGMKYQVDCSIHTPDGRNPCVTTVWIEVSPSNYRFVTAYKAKSRAVVSSKSAIT